VRKKLLITTAVILVIKLSLFLILDYKLKMTQDENANYEIAVNHHNGNGYTLFNSEKKMFISTAFRTSFPVFIYEFLAKRYRLHIFKGESEKVFIVNYDTRLEKLLDPL